MLAQPSAPRPFSLAARSVAACPKDSPSGQSLRSAVPVPPRRHPSLYARPAFRSPPLSSAARSVAAYPKDSPQGESPRFGWGGLSRRGPAPSLTPRLPSHAPPFPQPQRALGGGCREGGSPPDFPSCPAALPAGTGRFPHRYRNPQPRLVRTPRPSRSSNLGTAEIALLSGPRRVRGEAECAPGAHGARPERRETTNVVSLLSESGPPPGNGQRPFPGPARQRFERYLAVLSRIFLRIRMCLGVISTSSSSSMKSSALLQRHRAHRAQAHRVLRARRVADGGQVLRLADVQLDVPRPRVRAHDHARVYLVARHHEHLAAVLRVEQTVGERPRPSQRPRASRSCASQCRPCRARSPRKRWIMIPSPRVSVRNSDR